MTKPNDTNYSRKRLRERLRASYVKNTELELKYNKVIGALKLMVIGDKDRNPESRLALATLKELKVIN